MADERYLTVTALTKYIKYKFDHDHHLEEVLLEGEISNFKHNSRGHFYFTLKDETAQISATMFATYASKVKFEPENGMKVFVKGKVTVYEPSGTYQINVTEIKNDGIGDLYLAYEKLKKELAEKGLFNEEHKKPIPRFPKTIGVITSPTGAAIRDIINTISRRYPLCQIILYPAIVQGDDAKDNIAYQIKKANFDNYCDVLIVGRGGGSIEDLWAFNEPLVEQAAKGNGNDTGLTDATGNQTRNGIRNGLAVETTEALHGSSTQRGGSRASLGSLIAQAEDGVLIHPHGAVARHG